MTQKQLAEAINENREITYNGSPYRFIGYQMMRNPNGTKAYSAGLLDLSNERTVVWVDMNKL
ncbi:MAG: hypothetical protein NC122_04990 [Faecalibacterium sp.]|nr:hypothetical protein [Ruminococcus sp.]MCM1391883.1 hypothetical protein [Ruminococcus sp.]MCM1485541.1 hypothetical protein [Faecalibacterium sp.]